MKKLCLIIFFLFLFGNAIAMEEKIAEKVTLKFNAGVMSQYISRGSQLSNGPSPFVSGNAYFPYNIYIGFFTAKIDDTFHNGSSQEIDYYFGITPKFGNLGTKFAYQSYLYPGNDTNDNNPYSSEFVGEINYTLDKTSIAYRHYWQDQAAKKEFFKTTLTHNFNNFSSSLQYGDKVNTNQTYYSANISKNIKSIDCTIEYVSVENPGGSGNTQSRDYLSLILSKSF